MKMMAEMRRKHKRMISRVIHQALLFCLIFSTSAWSKVVVYPTTGLNIAATPGVSSSASLQFKPDASELNPVKYRLISFRINGLDVDKSKLTVSNLYLDRPHTLDRFQLVLSGKEKSNPVTSIFKFQPNWTDMPGNYTGLLTSDSDKPDIPVKVVVNPKATLTLTPINFKIVTSNFNTPNIQAVNVIFGTNSPRWELYLSASNLIKVNGDKLDKSKIYVRIKDDPVSSWKNLNQVVKIASGGSNAPREIVTLEFLVNADKLEKAGDYLGSISFLVKNI